MHGIIGENLQNLDAAAKDQKYQQYNQRKYEELLNDLAEYSNKHKGAIDRDMQDHIDELDKKELKSTGWTVVPLDNVDHDFVSDLLVRYITDI